MTMRTAQQKKVSKNAFAKFFTAVQDAKWYELFLTPAVDELRLLSAGSLVLDVGTGPGKFLELIKRQLSIDCVGADISESMLEEARKRSVLADIPLIKLEQDNNFPFPDSSFDAVSFCSVLFLLEEPEPLLKEALRIIRPSGKIMVLTPAGHGITKKENNPLSNILDLGYWTFSLWRISTRSKALEWKRKNTLSDFAAKFDLSYDHHSVFFNLAEIEVLQHRIET